MATLPRAWSTRFRIRRTTVVHVANAGSWCAALVEAAEQLRPRRIPCSTWTVRHRTDEGARGQGRGREPAADHDDPATARGVRHRDLLRERRKTRSDALWGRLRHASCSRSTKRCSAPARSIRRGGDRRLPVRACLARHGALAVDPRAHRHRAVQPARDRGARPRDRSPSADVVASRCAVPEAADGVRTPAREAIDVGCLPSRYRPEHRVPRRAALESQAHRSGPVPGRGAGAHRALERQRPSLRAALEGRRDRVLRTRHGPAAGHRRQRREDRVTRDETTAGHPAGRRRR